MKARVFKILRCSAIKNNQSGAMVLAITVTAMVVLALLAFTYAYLSSRSSAQVQESTYNLQAHYAAQTGINDVKRNLQRVLLDNLNIQYGGASYGDPVPRTGYSHTVPGGTAPGGSNIGHNSNVECLSENNLGSSSRFRLDFDISGDGTVGYSCVDIDFVPHLVYFDEISSSRPLNNVLDTLMEDTSGNWNQTNIDELKIKWQDAREFTSPHTYSFTNPNFSHPALPPFEAWTNSTTGIHAPVLRVQLTPFDSEGFHRDSLIEHTKVFYLYPTTDNTASTVFGRAFKHETFANIENGDILEAGCYDATTSANRGSCEFSVTEMLNSLDFPDTTDDDAIRWAISILSLYQNADVEIEAYHNNEAVKCPHETLRTGVDNLCVLDFQNIQAVVRVTGYAGSVRVRLEERVSMRPYLERPNYGVISAETVCKVLLSDQDTGTTITRSVFGLNLPDNLSSIGVDDELYKNCQL